MLVDGYCMREVAGKKGFVLVEYRILHGKIGVVGYVFESELKLGAKLLEAQDAFETHPELACQVVVIPPGVLGMIVTEEEIGLLVLNHCLDIEKQAVFLAQTEFPVGASVNRQVAHLLTGQEELGVYIKMQQLTLCASQLASDRQVVLVVALHLHAVLVIDE